jgi:hypothetical protein
MYILLNWVFRIVLPAPGKIEDFKAKKKMRDYHTYYFQFLSLVHALMGCIFGKRVKFIVTSI